MGVDPRWTENQRVAQAASGSANELVPALADIVATGHWTEFTHPMKGVLRFSSFSEYCDDFLGLSASAVEALLEKTNAKDAARQVRRMLAEAVEPVATHGLNQHGGVCDTKSSEQDATYVLARLKRDDPDLAQEVIDGKVSANAAAIRAGIRRRYVRVRPDDVGQAVGVLLKHYTREQLLEALG
jgi:hypothetical protein